jgi:hypothetical protein
MLASGMSLQRLARIQGHSIRVLDETYSEELAEFQDRGARIDPIEKARSLVWGTLKPSTGPPAAEVAADEPGRDQGGRHRLLRRARRSLLCLGEGEAAAGKVPISSLTGRPVPALRVTARQVIGPWRRSKASRA